MPSLGYPGSPEFWGRSRSPAVVAFGPNEALGKLDVTTYRVFMVMMGGIGTVLTDRLLLVDAAAREHGHLREGWKESRASATSSSLGGSPGCRCCRSNLIAGLFPAPDPRHDRRAVNALIMRSSEAETVRASTTAISPGPRPWGDAARGAGRRRVPARPREGGWRYAVAARCSARFVATLTLVGEEISTFGGHYVVDDFTVLFRRSSCSWRWSCQRVAAVLPRGRLSHQGSTTTCSDRVPGLRYLMRPRATC